MDKIFNINLMLRPNIVKVIDCGKIDMYNNFKYKSGVFAYQSTCALKKPLTVVSCFYSYQKHCVAFKQAAWMGNEPVAKARSIK